MIPLISRGKNRFILKINRGVYKNDAIAKAINEDKDWVTQQSSNRRYVCLELKTNDIKKVLEWSNYLLYLNKTV